MREPSEADRNCAEELLDAWEAGGKGYGDLADRIAVALANAKAGTCADARCPDETARALERTREYIRARYGDGHGGTIPRFYSHGAVLFTEDDQ